MPEISRFYGIVIRMNIDEHNPPHFHAEYSGKEAVFKIGVPSLHAGKIAPQATRLVLRWAKMHRMALLENWDRLRADQSIKKIKPLE